MNKNYRSPRIKHSVAQWVVPSTVTCPYCPYKEHTREKKMKRRKGVERIGEKRKEIEIESKKGSRQASEQERN